MSPTKKSLSSSSSSDSSSSFSSDSSRSRTKSRSRSRGRTSKHKEPKKRPTEKELRRIEKKSRSKSRSWSKDRSSRNKFESRRNERRDSRNWRARSTSPMYINRFRSLYENQRQHQNRSRVAENRPVRRRSSPRSPSPRRKTRDYRNQKRRDSSSKERSVEKHKEKGSMKKHKDDIETKHRESTNRSERKRHESGTTSRNPEKRRGTPDKDRKRKYDTGNDSNEAKRKKPLHEKRSYTPLRPPPQKENAHEDASWKAYDNKTNVHEKSKVYDDKKSKGYESKDTQEVLVAHSHSSRSKMGKDPVGHKDLEKSHSSVPSDSRRHDDLRDGEGRHKGQVKPTLSKSRYEEQREPEKYMSSSKSDRKLDEQQSEGNNEKKVAVVKPKRKRVETSSSSGESSSSSSDSDSSSSSEEERRRKKRKSKAVKTPIKKKHTKKSKKKHSRKTKKPIKKRKSKGHKKRSPSPSSSDADSSDSVGVNSVEEKNPTRKETSNGKHGKTSTKLQVGEVASEFAQTPSVSSPNTQREGDAEKGTTLELGPNPEPKEVKGKEPAKLKPMTLEDYLKQQSTVRRVEDPETGRLRLIRGLGEVIEEPVSRSRQKEINRHATQADGKCFQEVLQKTIKK